MTAVVVVDKATRGWKELPLFDTSCPDRPELYVMTLSCDSAPLESSENCKDSDWPQQLSVFGPQNKRRWHRLLAENCKEEVH